MATGVRKVVDNTDSLLDALMALPKQEVLVGIPADKAPRTHEPGEPEMNNAEIAYVQNFGSPALNIPAREFMAPGIRNVKDQITKRMKAAGAAALEGKKQAMAQQLNAAGMIASSSIKKKISEGPFQPLSDMTLRARARRGRKGAKEELARRADGLPPSSEGAKPLIDTAQMQKSITYVVRRK